MCLKHKWNHYGKRYLRGHQYRRCIKCDRIETLYHLLHAGISYHFYDEMKEKLPYEEIKRKEKKYLLLMALYFFSMPVFLLSTNFLPQLRFNLIIGNYHIPFMIFLLNVYCLGIIILYKMYWNVWKQYSITVDSEEVAKRFYPTKKERLRESQIKAEKILMYKLASGEIGREDYTARMARL